MENETHGTIEANVGSKIDFPTPECEASARAACDKVESKANEIASIFNLDQKVAQTIALTGALIMLSSYQAHCGDRTCGCDRK
jgi:hypothetical protein